MVNPWHLVDQNRRLVSAWEWAWLKEEVTGEKPVKHKPLHNRYRELVTKSKKIHLDLTANRYMYLLKYTKGNYPTWFKMTCVECKQEYLAHIQGYAHRKYCSQYCKMKAARKRRKRRLEAARVKKCLNCGTVFKAKRSDAKYCSSRCRVAYHRKKKRLHGSSDSGDEDKRNNDCNDYDARENYPK